jgi:hypothetical protein
MLLVAVDEPFLHVVLCFLMAYLSDAALFGGGCLEISMCGAWFNYAVCRITS